MRTLRWESAAEVMIFVLLSVLSGRPARAADTLETWDVGATNVDFYLGFDGIGRKREAQQLFGDILLGYGIVDRFSAYLGARLTGDARFSSGSGELHVGIFGTPVATDHIDLDLGLDISAAGSGFSEFQVMPALELNLDLDPQMRSAGLYLRSGLPVYGRKATSSPEQMTSTPTALSIVSTLGTYYRIGAAHQILLEYEMSFHPAADDGRTVEVGGVALGYNVSLTRSLEMINQLFLDIPQTGERAALGVMTGFIVTLPTLQRPARGRLQASQPGACECRNRTARPVPKPNKERGSPQKRASQEGAGSPPFRYEMSPALVTRTGPRVLCRFDQ